MSISNIHNINLRSIENLVCNWATRYVFPPNHGIYTVFNEYFILYSVTRTAEFRGQLLVYIKE